MTNVYRLNNVSAQQESKNKLNLSTINTICYFGFFLLIAIDLFNVDYSSTEPMVIFTFFLNFFLFCFALLYKSRKISILKLTALFNIVFFFIAPLHQYIANEVLWSDVGLSVSYSAEDYLMCNIYIFFIYLVFVVSYFLFSLKPQKIKKSKKPIEISNFWSFNFISLFAFLILLLSNNIFETTNYLPSSFSNLENQIYLMLRVAPVFCFISVYHFGDKSKVLRKESLIFIGIVCFILFYPFSGNLARFLLFGVYLSIIYCIFYKRNHIDGILNFGMLIGFFFFFSSSKLNSSLNWFSLPNFVYVDFDAYQLLMLTSKYIDAKGICYGLNILSATLFLIPRSVIPFKMGGTASAFMTYFGSSLDNVSTTFFAECLFGFGYIASIILIPIIGYLIFKLDHIQNEHLGLFSFSLICFSFGLSIYVCRGSLNASFAFLGAILTSSFILWLLLRNKHTSKFVKRHK